MKNNAYEWIARSGKLFESSASEAYRHLNEPGEEVEARGYKLSEFSVVAYFVMPELAGCGGLYNLLSLTRREGEREAVFLSVSYQARDSRFGFHMNAGNASPELVGVATRQVARQVALGRVLQLYVCMSRDRLYAAVHDGDLGHFEALGKPSGRYRHPWGGRPGGRWSAEVGRTSLADRGFVPLPPGFGLSDLQVSISSLNSRESAPPFYSGQLDHLTSGSTGITAQRRPQAWQRPVDPSPSPPLQPAAGF